MMIYPVSMIGAALTGRTLGTDKPEAPASQPAVTVAAKDDGGFISWVRNMLGIENPSEHGCDEWSGNTPEIPDGGDGGIIPPGPDSGLDTDDAGLPIITEETFDISGTTGEFQFTPVLPFGTVPLSTAGLQNAEGYVEIGLDSSVMAELLGLTDSCYDGLVNTTAPSPQDIADGVSCTDELLVCPSNPSERLHIYLASYTIEGLEYHGGEDDEWVTIPTSDPNASRVLISEANIENVLTNPELFDGYRLGVLCDPDVNDPNPNGDIVPDATAAGSISRIQIPSEFFGSADNRIRVTVRLLVDARGEDPNSTYVYETRLIVRMAN